MSLSEIIYNEENSLKNSKSPNESVNILYNLIKLYHKNNQKDDVYKNIKKFMVFYIELIKDADYGYDNFNYNKINDVLSLTSAEERISILQYIISVSSRELPEHGREWFVLRKHNAEISNIKENRQYKLYFRMALLYLGQSINRLIIVFILFFALVFTALLPSPFESITIFKIKYELYSNNFIEVFN